MYLNFICKSKVKKIHQINDQVYYTDNIHDSILEKFAFKTKEELFDFQSIKSTKK